MSEDRSLDEFAAGDDEEIRRDSEADGEAPDEKRDAPDEKRDAPDKKQDAPDKKQDAPDAIDAESVTSTATWTTDGAACDRCGESVSRRWLDDDALVCPACKEW